MADDTQMQTAGPLPEQPTAAPAGTSPPEPAPEAQAASEQPTSEAPGVPLEATAPEAAAPITPPDVSLADEAAALTAKAAQDIAVEKHSLLHDLHAEVRVVLDAIAAGAEWPVDKLKKLMADLLSKL